MDKKSFLDGFVPYREEVIRKYRSIGAWENLTYGDLLDRTSDKYPDNIAVVDSRTRLTYKDLKGDQTSLVIQDLEGNDLPSIRNFAVEIL